MRKRTIGVLALIVGFLSVPVQLFAHHGTAVFDTNKPLVVKGSVTEWDFFNPHCLLQFDAMDEGGQVVHWIAETQNPAEMVSLGWGKTSFKPGDEVAVTLLPAKNGKPFGRISLVALPDGKTFVTSKVGLTPKEIGDASDGSKPGNYPKQ